MKLHSVNLKFFCDDANGDYGLAPENSIDCNTPFNAFWNGTGFFHDVFEHYFEGKHKYFQDEFSFNVGGEMAAMGHAVFYWEQIGDIRTLDRGRNGNHFPDVAIRSTTDMVQESIEYGGWNYGSTLESCVPRQKDAYYGYSDFESCLAWQWDEEVSKYVAGKSIYSADEMESCLEYKKSVKKSKYLNLHRWGYNKAQRMFEGDTRYNTEILYDFIEFWNGFTKENNAEEWTNLYNGVTFNVTKEHGRLNWTARFDPHYSGDVKPLFLSGKNLHAHVPTLEDLYTYQENY